MRRPPRRTRWLVPALLGWLVACTSTVDVTSGPARPLSTTIPGSTTTTTIVVTSTTTTTVPATTVPATTTTAPVVLPPLSSFGVDIVWHTDLDPGSPERAAVEDALVIAMLTGLEGPPEFTVLAFDDEARMRDAIVLVLGVSPDDAMVEIERYAGLAYWLRPGGDDTTYYYLLLDVETEYWPDPFWAVGPTVIHEWFHFHQYVTTEPWIEGRWSEGRSAGSDDDAAAPEWLVEGSARWFEREAIQAAGRSAEGSEILREWLTYWDRPPAGLSAWEDVEGFLAGDLTEAYEVAGGAVDLLVEIAGETAVLDTYWNVRAEAADASWRDVFRLVFGLTPEEFYERVDEAAGYG